MDFPQNFDAYSKRFVEHAPYPVFFVCENHRVCWVNQLAIERQVVSGGTFVGAEVADVLFDWGVQADEVGEVLLCLEGGYPQRVSCSGDAWLSLDVDVVHRDSEAVGFVISLLPVRFGDYKPSVDGDSERLFRMMAHAARGHLHAISGYCELLIGSEVEELSESEELLSILEAKEQLSRLWNDAEDLADLSGQGEGVQKEKFAVDECLRDIVDAASEELARSGKTLEFEYSKNLPAVLIGNLSDLSRLITRLLCDVNLARKVDRLVLKVSWANPSRLDRPALRFEVMVDEDAGLEWEELRYDVEPQEELGVCQTIVLKLVNRIGGRFFKKGVNGGCSRVLMDLALDPSFENGALGEIEQSGVVVAAEDAGSAGDGSSRYFGLRMIVVDDSELSAEVNRRLLLRLGVKDVVAVTSSAEAISLYGKQPFDVAFLDLQMPDMDGFGLCSRLKEKAEFSNSILKVVAITGGAARKSSEKSVVAGFDECLVKPVTIADLNETCCRMAEDIFEKAKVSSAEASKPKVFEVGEVKEIGLPILSSEEWENDPVLHKRMLAMLLEDAPMALERIAQEMESGNEAQLERVVHYFKGSVDVVRADRLADIAQRALNLLEGGEVDDARRLLSQLPGEYEKFTEYLRKTSYLEGTQE